MGQRRKERASKAGAGESTKAADGADAAANDEAFTVNLEIFAVKNNLRLAQTTKIKHVKYFLQRIIKILKIYTVGTLHCVLVSSSPSI